MIPAGSLRHKVTLESRTATKDATGQRAYTWSTLATVRAAIKTGFARESGTASGTVESKSTIITIRYSSTVAALNSDDRVTDANTGTVYDIESVTNKNEENRILELTCTEKSHDQ